jgi:hypothetical protein
MLSPEGSTREGTSSRQKKSRQETTRRDSGRGSRVNARWRNRSCAVCLPLLVCLLLPLRAALAQSLSSTTLSADTASTDSPQILSNITLPPPFPQLDPSSSGSAPPPKAVVQTPYGPITARQRLRWFVFASVGPQSLGVGVLSAGLGTARHKPVEYDTHWDGFGKRYGMRLTGVLTGNAMEAGMGALWGEDPRYFRTSGQPFGKRIKNILVLTVAARGRDDELHPAYARFIAKTGSNFLSNTWRPESDSTSEAALVRVGLGFASKLASNAFQEFMPELKHYVFRRPVER